jgi:hypothetical protein
MLFERIFVVTLAAGLVAAAGACSNDANEAPSTKQGTEAACERINGMCADSPGYQKADCSRSNAAYASLSAADKAKADAVIPCVMRATGCQPALACVRGPSSDSTAKGGQSTPASTDASAACEHINDVCQGQSGFKQQDCSGSDAAYAKLTPQEKATADSIAPCVLGATTCDDAFACLKQLQQQQQ